MSQPFQLIDTAIRFLQRVRLTTTVLSWGCRPPNPGDQGGNPCLSRSHDISSSQPPGFNDSQPLSISHLLTTASHLSETNPSGGVFAHFLTKAAKEGLSDDSNALSCELSTAASIRTLVFHLVVF